MSRMTTFRLSEDQRKLLMNDGRISELSLIPAFGPLTAYRTTLPEVRKTNVPALDQEVKSTGSINCNNISYIKISKQYLSDAIKVLISHPAAYMKGLLRAYFFYFLPSSDVPYLRSNCKHIQGLERWYDVLIYGRFQHNSSAALEAFYREANYGALFFNMGLFMLIGLPFLVFYGLRLTWRALSSGFPDPPFALTVLFLCTNLIYVTLIGNCVEYGENNRFRYTIEPFFIVILGLFLTRKLKKKVRQSPSYAVQ